MTKRLIKPIKIFGGKHYLTKKIIALIPEHTHYVEPYFGGGSVLLAKDPEGISEVVNDIDGDLTNFWMVLRNPDFFPRFQRACETTPFSEDIWKLCHDGLLKNTGRNDTFLAECQPVQRAWMYFVCCRMSLSGRMKSFTAITKTRTRRGMNNEVSAWLSAIEGLPEVHSRLKRVLILNRDGVEVIRSQDSKHTVQYLDPPYLHETRIATEVYRHEMTTKNHEELLETIIKCKSKILLSGYRSPLYDNNLKKWKRVDFDLPNHAAGGKVKRRMVESVWMNY